LLCFCVSLLQQALELSGVRPGQARELALYKFLPLCLCQRAKIFCCLIWALSPSVCMYI
jgi:hypothetical protein